MNNDCNCLSCLTCEHKESNRKQNKITEIKKSIFFYTLLSVFSLIGLAIYIVIIYYIIK